MGNGIIKYIRKLIKYVLKIIYYSEEECVICGKRLFEGLYLCDSCRNKIKSCEESKKIEVFNKEVRIYSALYYSSAVKKLVLALKYKSDFICGDVLASYMIKIIHDKKIKFDIITYVPLSFENKKKRGYNQSKYLAKCIGEKFDKKVVDLIKKSRKTRDQIGLNEEERWINLKDSFSFRKGKKVENKKILLVDDVVTTGATAHYCILELLKNNAGEIIFLTAAKSKI
ncbi:ComF family protein [Haloimpatiens lingqiaonensis]|uniref:ComF family protein n=1 Tax=Haloimpatiens lingqiaonensis TaxID=1380675 RepID=UPI0010FD7985|nr:ComF family protein [Haloimpatiens lingqiaonensis]